MMKYMLALLVVNSPNQLHYIARKNDGPTWWRSSCPKEPSLLRQASVPPASPWRDAGNPPFYPAIWESWNLSEVNHALRR